MVQQLEKFQSATENTLFEKLPLDEKQFIEKISLQYNFSFQEVKQLIEFSRDLEMWEEPGISEWWNGEFSEEPGNKKQIFNKLRTYLARFKGQENVYPEEGLSKPKRVDKKKIAVVETDKKIFGKCPVASEKTVCCNLKTIDAVENCAFGCSYCTIQTFYEHTFTFDKDFQKKLDEIEIDPNKKHHFGTGQSSDSLVWGNKNGNLEALCNFAKKNPNIVLEFKTKSNNIKYLLENEIPKNVLCTWSLNPDTLVDNEEHFTASLSERLDAAERVAKKGIKVGFHFHPMVLYSGWQEGYSSIVNSIKSRFNPKDILFISFGTLTYIKPVLKKIRNLGLASKILQMDLVKDPHGKFTYPDDIKAELFNHMLNEFNEWKDEVFFYLCMEKSDIWMKTFGWFYETNKLFEEAMLSDCFKKINA